MRISGQPEADLFAATTGTDADWVVKLIDVQPALVPSDPSMGGYQLPVGMDIFRGRYRQDFAHPAAIPAGQVERYRFTLPPTNHVFEPGHRIMVQVQSSWFPLYDRNPQTLRAEHLRGQAGGLPGGDDADRACRGPSERDVAAAGAGGGEECGTVTGSETVGVTIGDEGADLSNWRASPFSRWAFYHVDKVLPVAAIAAGPQAMALPDALQPLDERVRLSVGGRSLDLAAVLQATATDGIVVLQDGRIVYERYFNGMTQESPHILMSATKSVVGG